MKQCWSLRSAMLLVAVCVTSPALSADVSTDGESSDQYGMQCSPGTGNPDTNVAVTLPKDRGNDFAVIGPSGQYFFLTFIPSSDTDPIKPVLPYMVFSTVNSLDFKLGSMKGWVQENGDTKLAPIFTRSGSYKFVISRDLERDDPEFLGWCRVEFSKE